MASEDRPAPLRVRSALALAAALALAGGCASGGGSDAPGGSLSSRPDAGEDGTGPGEDGGGSGDAATWPGEAQACYLLTCTNDAECQGCTFGRTRCETSSGRCVACDPATMQGCPSGQTCTQYGTCVAPGTTCPIGGGGLPNVTCQTDQDCAACDPHHQACDVATHSCVECSASNTSVCQPNEACNADYCAARCPSYCNFDSDCVNCGNGLGVAHACNFNTHSCAECSRTLPCPGNQVCSAQGRCMDPCGMAGEPKGSCTSDDDCKGCGNVAIACHQAINGGLGKCGVPASGCSDLGMGVTALPPPWDAVTNTCSNDEDCQNVGLTFNVGKLMRDLTSVEQIHDANIQYGMNSCASVSIQGASCGICVPCKSDADCKPIDLDPLLTQMLGPLGVLAEKLILDQVFGSGEHKLNMYCENVAGDYGVCAPCSDPTQVCGVGQTTGSGCANDYECAWGEICKSDQCTSVQNGCTTDADCAGAICGWHGVDANHTSAGYCCQPPGPAQSSTCVSDSDCTVPGQVCIWNGQHFYCNVAQCQ